MEKDVAVAKARKPANQAHMLAAEEVKGTVKLEEPKEHDVENTMDSEPDLADEPDDDELDMPNAGDDPEKLAESEAWFNVTSPPLFITYNNDDFAIPNITWGIDIKFCDCGNPSPHV